MAKKDELVTKAQSIPATENYEITPDMKLNDIKMPHIIAFMEKRPVEEIEEFNELAHAKRVNKNGKEYDASYVEVRNTFAKKYFPQLIESKGKTSSMKLQFEALLAKKKDNK